MDLSESYKRLQAKKNSEVESNKKAREKLFRALLNILPGLGGLSDACMALVDAKREQVVEDSIKMLEVNYGVIKIQELELITEVEEIQENLLNMANDITVLKGEFTQLLEAKEYYQSIEIKKLIISNIEIGKQTLSNTETIINKIDNQELAIKKMTDLIEKVFDKPELAAIRKEIIEGKEIGIDAIEPITDDEVIIKMGEQVISKVNELIEKNEFNAALSILDGLVSSSNFNDLNEDLRIGVLATKGLVYIKLFDREKARGIFDDLEKFKTNNKRKWNYAFKFGIIINDEFIVNKALVELEKLGLSEDELTVKKSSYLLALGKTNEIISLLADDIGEVND